MAESQIEKLMRILEVSEEDALRIIKADEQIDKGEKLFELSADQKKASKKARQVAKAVNPYGKTVIRERKIDTDKRAIINALVEPLEKLTDENTVYINNEEREIEFVRKGRKYRIILSCPRS